MLYKKGDRRRNYNWHNDTQNSKDGHSEDMSNSCKNFKNSRGKRHPFSQSQDYSIKSTPRGNLFSRSDGHNSSSAQFLPRLRSSTSLDAAASFVPEYMRGNKQGARASLKSKPKENQPSIQDETSGLKSPIIVEQQHLKMGEQLHNILPPNG